MLIRLLAFGVFKSASGVPVVAQQKWIWLVSMRMWVQSLASLSGLKSRHCHELWCRFQMWLGSCVAVAMVQATAVATINPPSLETSICHRCGPENTKKKKKSMLQKIKLLERVTGSHRPTIPSSDTDNYFCCQNACFSLFCLLACALSTLKIFSGVLFLLLLSINFPPYTVIYPLFFVGKKDWSYQCCQSVGDFLSMGKQTNS